MRRQSMLHGLPITGLCVMFIQPLHTVYRMELLSIPVLHTTHDQSLILDTSALLISIIITLFFIYLFLSLCIPYLFFLEK